MPSGVQSFSALLGAALTRQRAWRRQRAFIGNAGFEQSGLVRSFYSIDDR